MRPRRLRLWASPESHSPRSETGLPSRSPLVRSRRPACVLGGLRRGSLRQLLRRGRRLVESEGSAPTSTCLHGRCITCLPRPHENGRPPRCCPERTEFWRLGRASWRAACRFANRQWSIADSRLFRLLVIGYQRLRRRRWRLPGRHHGGRPQGPTAKLKGPEASLRLRPVPFQ